MGSAPELQSVMENWDFSYSSYISIMNACVTNLPLPFSIITSKHIFEGVAQILFGFSMKLAIEWRNLLQCRHFGVTLHPINKKHMASLLVSRLLCLFFYTAFLKLGSWATSHWNWTCEQNSTLVLWLRWSSSARLRVHMINVAHRCQKSSPSY